MIYNMYLKEWCYRWRVDKIKKGLPYPMEDSGELLKAYSQAREHEIFLMCECYMQGLFLLDNAEFLPNLFIREV